MSAKMYRSQERILAGVCGGLAEHLGIKVGLVRAIMIGTTFFFGAGPVFYGWLWLLVPMAGEQSAKDKKLLDADGNPRLKLFRPGAAAAADAAAADNPQRSRPTLTFRDVLIGGVLLIAAVIGCMLIWRRHRKD